MYLEEIPSGWKIAKMGDVCELRKETINPSNFPDMPYVGLEHIDSGDSHYIYKLFEEAGIYRNTFFGPDRS